MLSPQNIKRFEEKIDFFGLIYFKVCCTFQEGLHWCSLQNKVQTIFDKFYPFVVCTFLPQIISIRRMVFLAGKLLLKGFYSFTIKIVLQK